MRRAKRGRQPASRAIGHARGHLRVSRFARQTTRKKSSLRGRRLKGKGKGVLGARETRGAREEGDCS